MRHTPIKKSRGLFTTRMKFIKAWRMTLKWSWFYVKALCRNLISAKAITAVLSVFGALWLIISLATFFFPTTTISGTTALPDAIRHVWPLFLIGGLVIAIWRCKPRLRVLHKLKGRDVSIEIAASDIFLLPGALIIGSNTTFDTRIPAVISARSVQGLFTQMYCHGRIFLRGREGRWHGGAMGR